MSALAEAYRAVSAGVGLIDRSNRARVEVSGPDRVKFLHNVTTNDVKRLPAGRGHEAFVTSLQGKTLGYVSLLASDELILLRTDPGALASMSPHVQKYGVFDEVALDDVSARTFELHLAGPSASVLLERSGSTPPGPEELSHRMTVIGDRAVRVVRESPTGRPGLTLIGAIADAAAVSERLHGDGKALGLIDFSDALYEILRIEAGTPVYGRDVTAENLPQELGRDARAISFVKGCYLGQETVARIDALGHVNKLMKGLRLKEDGPAPNAGSPLLVDGTNAGTVTSSAFSPGWGVPIALAIVRAKQARAGTEVKVVSSDGERDAVVCDLPNLPAEFGPLFAASLA